MCRPLQGGSENDAEALATFPVAPLQIAVAESHSPR